MSPIMEATQEKRRRESYECLYGLRFPNAKVYDEDNCNGFNGDSDTSKNVFTGNLIIMCNII